MGQYRRAWRLELQRKSHGLLIRNMTFCIRPALCVFYASLRTYPMWLISRGGVDGTAPFNLNKLTSRPDSGLCTGALSPSGLS